MERKERRFAKNLTGPGSAARMRENVSLAIKESANLNKPKLVEPLDYETMVVKNKTLLHNDPQRELLLFPFDDMSQSTLPRRFRTMISSVPPDATKEAKSLMVKECIKTYTSHWHVIHYKYSGYSGSYLNLPKLKANTENKLPEQNFEVDVELDEKDEEANNKKSQNITKQGWLYKGPDSGSETSIISFTRSFKRRYFYLKQQQDTTYVMEFHKDDKKLESKGAIFLDSAVSVSKSSKRGKHAFELKMQEQEACYLFAAESEAEMDSWIKTLQKVIEANESSSFSMKDKSQDKDNVSMKSENFRESLLRAAPIFQKYAHENDGTLATRRREQRQKLFNIYPELRKTPKETDKDHCDDTGTKESELYKDEFGTRFIVRCEDFKMRLQANLSEEGHGDKESNPEPFYVRLALYDVKEGKKISEDFHYDPNSPEIRGMVPDEITFVPEISRNGSTQNGTSEPTLHGLKHEWMAYPKMAVFSVSNPHPDIYLVAHIDKVLQGSITGSADPYTRTPDPKQGLKQHKTMKGYCGRLGHYRQPFAWAPRRAFKNSSDSLKFNNSTQSNSDSDKHTSIHSNQDRPIFKPFSVELDTFSDFSMYRAEGSKMSEVELIKQLQDIKNKDKQAKLQPVLGNLRVKMYEFKSTLANTLTASLLPVKPFEEPSERGPALEIEEFVPCNGEYAYPYTTYKNNLYIYPKCLKYDSQKAFAKARNIACHVELRDNDEEGTTALQCIYGYGGSGVSVFKTSKTTSVLHHNTTPSFIDEIKALLPTQLNGRHHLVFTFVHVSCDLAKSGNTNTAKRKSQMIESIVGYAWLPLITENGKLCVGEQSVKIATHLPPGYLGHEQFGIGQQGTRGPEIKWVDTRPLFTFHLRLTSTVYTEDQHLHNFFSHCQNSGGQSTAPATLDFETKNRLKAKESDLAAISNSSVLSGHKGPAPTSPQSPPASPYDRNMLTFVKSLHAVDVRTLINFLPTLFNQLFSLLQHTSNEEVALNTLGFMIHAVYEVHQVNKPEILKTYAKYVFETPPAAMKDKTVHEEMAKYLKLTLQPTRADQLVVGKFMKHSWFFFDILIKSMAQHLLSTGRVKMARNERFPASFQFHVQNLVQNLVSHIIQKHKDILIESRKAPHDAFSSNNKSKQKLKQLSAESKNANISLAKFIKKCFTFMDRGFVMRLINKYIENFGPGDAKTLYEYKFEFMRIVCEQEHYIPLNLPIMRRQVKNYKDLKHDYTLSEEFRRNHFLVGLLLQEVKQALNEIRDIRKVAIETLRNLLAKHSFDDRYSNKTQQHRIATLYLPFISVILDNKKRLIPKATLPSMHDNYNGDSYLNDSLSRPGIGSFDSNVSLDKMSDRSSAMSERSSASLGRAVPRDPKVFAMISGQGNGKIPSALDLTGKLTHTESMTSVSSDSSTSSTKTLESEGSKEKSPSHHHSRASSLGGLGGSTNTLQQAGSIEVRFDKLEKQEIKDLLVCFLYIVKNLSQEILLGWFTNSSEVDVLDFFGVLEICMQQFIYEGKKKITSFRTISDTRTGSRTMPVKAGSTGNPVLKMTRFSAGFNDLPGQEGSEAPSTEVDSIFRALQEANMSTEVSMVVLDVISLYTANFKDSLQFKEGDNHVMHKVFDIYLHFLQTSQSETVQKHAFAALRLFIHKFPKVLFQGDATMCGRLCYEILRCCNCRLKTTRQEACTLMYLLMRSNFEFNKKKNFIRVHLQMIIAVSTLISISNSLNNSRFIDSLSVINSFASDDQGMKNTTFPGEAKDLTKRIRTVLMATAQMKEHQDNPEMLIDLQYSLAKSYTSTPELRKTWLENMARHHENHGNFSEAAHCYIHIAALVAEYLKRRGEFPQGCRAFRGISGNVASEEQEMKEDSGMHDVQYTQDHLADLLEECAKLLEKAERYELLGELYRLIIPIYESNRDFERLASAYNLLATAYNKVVDVMHSGKRLLGKYFRVAFFGQNFEEENTKQYIYKEPKVTGLPEICDRLKKMYNMKYGEGNVKLIMESSKVKESELDPKYSYVQVTHVTPWFDPAELETRRTDFEKNNNIKKFMFETPFTKNGKARGEISEQYRRRTILTTSHSFPYVKKRIQVVYTKESELSPIDCAIDEMTNKLADLTEVVNQPTPDMKKLQLRLQGSVSAQVNAGPLAYAEAFLVSQELSKSPARKTDKLKELFRDFIEVCGSALELNHSLISTEQFEYHEALRQNYREMGTRLGEIFGEQLLPDEDQLSTTLSHRGSMSVFSQISSTSNSSSNV